MLSPEKLRDDDFVSSGFLDTVYFINLDRCFKRYWAMMAWLHAALVPFEIIERFPAKDGMDYEHEFDVIEDMADDGFPHYRAFYDYESYWQKPKNMCVCWSHISVLRMIVNRNETALVFEDDTCLATRDFWHIDSLAADLPNLEVLYLNHFHWSDVDADFTKDEYMREESLYLRELLPTGFSQVFSNSYGMGARARVFTSCGAKIFLDYHLEYPWIGSENIGWYMKRGGRSVENHYLYEDSEEYMPTFSVHDLRFLGEML